jgi:hypothetical protein
MLSDRIQIIQEYKNKKKEKEDIIKTTKEICEVNLNSFVTKDIIAIPISDKERINLLTEAGLDQEPILNTKSMMIIDKKTKQLIGGIAISKNIDPDGKLCKTIKIIDNSADGKVKLALSKILIHPNNAEFQDAKVTSSDFKTTTFMQPEHERNNVDEFNDVD